MSTATPIRVSTHQLHHEANRFFELGRVAYLDRLNGRVTSIEKLAAAMLYLGYLADARGSDEFYRLAHEVASRLVNVCGHRASVTVVWSRRHECYWDRSDLDDWVEQKVTVNA